MSSGLIALAALLAGAAAWLAVPARGHRWRSPRRWRALSVELHHWQPWEAGRRLPGWRGLLAGRADAIAPSRRVALAVLVSAALAVGSRPWVAPRGWAMLPLVGLVALCCFVALGLLEPASARERSRQLVADTPTALELIAAGLAAGLPPRGATAAVVAALDGPVSADLGIVRQAVELGVSDADAWRVLSSHPTLGPAALELARSVDSGTRLVEVLLRHAERAREQRLAALEVSAKAVGVRCVLPMMICFIPAFMLLGIVPTVVSAFIARLPAGILTP